jgi:hypothetical protein
MPPLGLVAALAVMLIVAVISIALLRWQRRGSSG